MSRNFEYWYGPFVEHFQLKRRCYRPFFEILTAKSFISIGETWFFRLSKDLPFEFFLCFIGNSSIINSKENLINQVSPIDLKLLTASYIAKIGPQPIFYIDISKNDLKQRKCGTWLYCTHLLLKSNTYVKINFYQIFSKRS